MNQKIKQRLSFVPALQPELKKAIYEQDWTKVEMVLDTAESAIEEGQAEKQQEQIRLLRGYLERNWEYLVPIAKRELGEELHGIGACESNHRPYSYRVKGQGKYWSKTGATNVVYVIQGLKNGTLDQAILEQMPAYQNQQSSTYRSALKAAHKKIPHQLHVGAKQGSIPFSGSSSSSMGRMSKALSSL